MLDGSMKVRLAGLGLRVLLAELGLRLPLKLFGLSGSPALRISSKLIDRLFTGSCW